MDIRMPSIPAAELTEHSTSLATLRWAPHSSSHLMTGDGERLQLWNLQNSVASSIWELPNVDITGHAASTQIHQLVWPSCAPDWLAVSTPDCVYAFQL